MKGTVFMMALVASASSFAQFSYYEDFQGTIGSEWSTSTTINVQASQNRIGLGPFSNDTATLTLTGFTVGANATLEFDLYILNSWDGSTPGAPQPDYFTTSIDGVNVVNATFAVRNEWLQTYSPTTPLGSSSPVAGNTGADESGNLDYNFYGSAVYKFGGGTNPLFTFTPTAATAVIQFTGSGLQGWTDEGWAIDNVRVTQAVPEPASMIALASGFIALARKRKK